MFQKNKLSAPMMVYTASPFLGPEIGPVIGGFSRVNCRCNSRLRLTSTSQPVHQLAVEFLCPVDLGWLRLDAHL